MWLCLVQLVYRVECMQENNGLGLVWPHHTIPSSYYIYENKKKDGREFEFLFSFEQQKRWWKHFQFRIKTLNQCYVTRNFISLKWPYYCYFQFFKLILPVSLKKWICAKTTNQKPQFSQNKSFSHSAWRDFPSTLLIPLHAAPVAPATRLLCNWPAAYC